MGLRFITPESTRLAISGGEFIDIKKRLTHGERDDMLASMATMTPGGLLEIAPRIARAIKVATYLLGWSSPVPMSSELSVQARVDTLNGLDPDDFDELERVLDGYLAAEAVSKNVQGGAPASAPTSASVAP